MNQALGWLRSPLVLLGALSLGGCAGWQVTQREVLGITGGGVGESWILVQEVEGQLGELNVDSNRYLVYQCLPSGCKAVSIIQGSQRQRRKKAQKK